MKQNIVIILPYGDLNPSENRKAQRAEIFKHLHHLITTLADRKKHYFLLSPEQIHPKKYFNRGQLINIAIKFFKDNMGSPTSIILHDIDILPDMDMFKEYSARKASYSLIPANTQLYKQIYDYKLFTGSAVYLTTPKTFIDANGFPNNMWGWGGEDDILHARYTRSKVKLAYNHKGQFQSRDMQRGSPREKLDFLKQSKVRNMSVRELKQRDLTEWRDNGYNQLIHMNYRILDKNILTGQFYTDVFLSIELDVDNLDETIAHNEAIYHDL